MILKVYMAGGCAAMLMTAALMTDRWWLFGACFVCNAAIGWFAVEADSRLEPILKERARQLRDEATQ